MSKTMNPGLGSWRFKSNRSNVCVMRMAALYWSVGCSSHGTYIYILVNCTAVCIGMRLILWVATSHTVRQDI